MPLESLQNGRYRILRPLGSGSMGEVYLVDDTRINRQVAIKVIRTEAAPYPDSNTTQDAARLFEREAKSIARLNHANILPLFDFGEEIVNGTPFTYMVMPYCPDGSLASWLQARNPAQALSLQDVAHFLHQAADALQHAHDNDIIHQDVKPQNFLLRSNKNAKLPDLLLADFGIAKLTAGTSGASQAIRGTPIYMAPEQWEGQPVPASDQYALAVMIYQLLTGRPPFQGGPGQMMYQHFNVAPQPPSSINPALSKDIDAVILRAMAKRPQDRFASISAFDQAFQQAMALDGPTMLQTQQSTGGDGIQATLAISTIEAVNGTSRTLTLSNGQRIRVVVPPGIQNGQLLRVAGQDETGSNSNITIPLLLTIAVTTSDANFPSIPVSGDRTFTGGIGSPPVDFNSTAQSDHPTFIAEAGRTTVSNQPTILSANADDTINNNPTVANYPAVLPNMGRNTLPPEAYASGANFNNAGNVGNIGAPPLQQNPIPPQRRRRNTIVTLLIIILVLLILVGSVGFAFSYYAGNNATIVANGTSTAQSNTATSQNNGTSSTQGNDTATATSALQATANAQASATANSQNKTNANATATANQLNNANATATVVAQNNSNATAVAATQTANVTPTTFTVQSITMAVNPTSIAGTACGTYVTVTYTATFVVPANSPGGTIQFSYTVNNGRGSSNASVTFNAGETSKSYSFTWAGNLPADHTYPGIGEVMTSSPNQVTSQGIQPSGQCV